MYARNGVVVKLFVFVFCSFVCLFVVVFVLFLFLSGYFSLILRRSISVHYIKSCGNVTYSRLQ